MYLSDSRDNDWAECTSVTLGIMIGAECTSVTLGRMIGAECTSVTLGIMIGAECTSVTLGRRVFGAECILLEDRTISHHQPDG